MSVCYTFSWNDENGWWTWRSEEHVHIMQDCLKLTQTRVQGYLGKDGEKLWNRGCKNVEFPQKTY